MAWSNFEHLIWNTLKKHELDLRDEFILAVSGGLDSMAMLEVMQAIKPQAKLIVAYYHHGDTDDEAQKNYRDQCQDLIQKAVTSNPNIIFKTQKSSAILNSEAEFRDARWSFLNSLQTANQPILTAHHRDDWVETLTLKMIRGVGPDGFLAFKAWDGRVFRPFLECGKADLKQYLDSKNRSFLEDPSNQSLDYLRNWVREIWFPMLDEKNPSGYQNYSRSMLRIQQNLQDANEFSLHFHDENGVSGLDRMWFFSLGETQQLKALAQFLRYNQIFQFTEGQLKEIKKRLDKNQKDLTFTLINIKWVINATQIVLEF